MLDLVPLTLRQVNTFIREHHRHHKEVQGHRFSIGVVKDGKLVGACSVGRPVSRLSDPYKTAEVTRLVTDGTKNSCSFLYSAAARACKAMGFEKIQTYILDIEIGASLKASGWSFDGMTAGGYWKHTSGPRRTDQPINPKKRWIKILKDNPWQPRGRTQKRNRLAEPKITKAFLNQQRQ